MPHRIAKQIYDRVLAARFALLIPHQHPDGDAMGSVGSFMEFLRERNVPHGAFCATKASEKFNFLPNASSVSTDTALWQTPELDTVIVFDSGDLKYAGVDRFIEQLPTKPTIIVFDHHATNQKYGDYNLVIPTAASTTEILYRFYRANHVAITPASATCLLTGLLTDTDSFTNGATSAAALQIAGDLIRRGGDVNMIKEWVFQDKTIATLKLWGLVLSRLSKHEQHEVVYTYVTQDDLKEHKVSDAESDGIANFMNNLSDGRAGLILKETEDGKFKGSFRTTRDDTDVSKIAKRLGGGGHKKAAGFTVDGDIEQALKKIWEVIGEHGLEKNDE
ncbi:MAG: DHHA1 domain-containing protein [Patescibacteria group bacterium]